MVKSIHVSIGRTETYNEPRQVLALPAHDERIALEHVVFSRECESSLVSLRTRELDVAIPVEMKTTAVIDRSTK